MASHRIAMDDPFLSSSRTRLQEGTMLRKEFCEPPTAAQLSFVNQVKWLCARSVNVVHTHTLQDAIDCRTRSFSDQDSNLWNFTSKSASFLLVVQPVLCRSTSFSPPLPHDAKRETQKKRTNLPHEFVAHVTETPIRAMKEETGT